MRPLVLIESPFQASRLHLRALYDAYLDACILDSLERGETPLATHKLYTGALNDTDPTQRQLGIERSKELLKVVSASIVYYDLGVSSGMWYGIYSARADNIAIIPRSLYGHPVPKGL